MVLVKVAVLGGTRVGKTSLLHQFVAGRYSDVYSKTKRKNIYFPSAFINDQIYELMLADLPPVVGIPSDSLEEWEHYPGFGLRNAQAFILVFDLSQPESFQVVVDLRSQLSVLRPAVPVLVVGTKLDLLSIGGAPSDAAKNICHLIRKQWKAPYVECSAKCNWKVMAVFEELVSLIDSKLASDQYSKGKTKNNSSGRINGTRRSQSAQPRGSRPCIMQ